MVKVINTSAKGVIRGSILNSAQLKRGDRPGLPHLFPNKQNFIVRIQKHENSINFTKNSVTT